MSEVPGSSAAAELPIHLTRFIGRERELEELARLLQDTRFLTLTGAGGSGKTRLAREVALHSAAAFARVGWVDLAPIANGELVAQQVATALHIHDRPSVTPLNLLIEALYAERALIVLDNCEHVVEACAPVAEALLRGCPRLTILATSREALGVSSETAWLVPPLATTEAIQLFSERARLALPSFGLSNCSRVQKPLIADVIPSEARDLHFMPFLHLLDGDDSNRGATLILHRPALSWRRPKRSTRPTCAVDRETAPSIRRVQRDHPRAMRRRHRTKRRTRLDGRQAHAKSIRLECGMLGCSEHECLRFRRAVERFASNRRLAQIANVRLRLEQFHRDVVERRAPWVSRDMREVPGSVVHAQVGGRDRRVRRAELRVDDGARAERNPEVVRVVFVQQRRVVCWHANTEHPKSGVAVREMVMRFALREHRSANGLRAGGAADEQKKAGVDEVSHAGKRSATRRCRPAG